MEEIILCDFCESKGTTEHEELEDYHHNTYDRWTEVCGKCGGSGRLIKVTEITYKPYVNKEVSEKPKS